MAKNTLKGNNLDSGDNMMQWETLYPDVDSLYATLREGRTAGRNRLAKLKPLLDAIMDSECDWTDLQCANCFRNLLKQYIDPNLLTLLLASSGLEEGYGNIKTASKRREAYSRMHLENTYEVDLKTLEKRENTELYSMAEFMWRDYNTDPTILTHVIIDSLSRQEILSLGFIVPGADKKDTFITESESGLRFWRDYSIYNIALSSDCFVGRRALLLTIEKRFKDGNHIQMIGGANGVGKTRLALEYAQTHTDKYRFVCWINGYSKAHIIDSAINFLRLVNVEITDRLMDHVPQIFCAFFEQNKDWLIVINDVDLVHSMQYEILKEYLPSGSGDILITSNIGMQLEGAEFYLLDSFINSDGDQESFVKRRLGLETLGKSDLELISCCNGDPVTLTLATSYIMDLAWVDSRIYLHMLDDRGVNANWQGSHMIANIAFDLLMENINTKQKYLDNPVCLAVKQLLLLCAKLNYNYLDLNLLADMFLVLPDSIVKVWGDASAKELFIDMLKLFGIYEVNDGRIIINEEVRRLAAEFYKAQDGWGTLGEFYRNMEKTIQNILRNQFVENKEAVLSHIKPYIDSMYAYLVVFKPMARDEMEQKFSFLVALSFET